MSNWNDDVLKGINNTINLFNFILQERAQLYGALIRLMQTYDVDEFSISKDEFKSVGESHYILLVPSEDKTALTIKLMEQEKAEEE